MTFGAAPPQPPREPERPKQLRTLWRVERRKQFRSQIITSALYNHPHGHELRVFLGDETDSNLLHSELARWDYTPLEEKAASLREVLLEKGRSDLPLAETDPAVC
jgi:hypothetical protein